MGSRCSLFGIVWANRAAHVAPKKIALTFDDGPNPAVTPQLLDLLDRYSVPATFFLIGKFVSECPGLVQEMSVRGHLLGNHTDTHANLIFQSRGGNSRRVGAMPGRDCRRHGRNASLDAAAIRLPEPAAWRRSAWGGNTGCGHVVENLLGLESATAAAIDRAARERRASGPAAGRHRGAA